MANPSEQHNQNVYSLTRPIHIWAQHVLFARKTGVGAFKFLGMQA